MMCNRQGDLVATLNFTSGRTRFLFSLCFWLVACLGWGLFAPQGRSYSIV